MTIIDYIILSYSDKEPYTEITNGKEIYGGHHKFEIAEIAKDASKANLFSLRPAKPLKSSMHNDNRGMFVTQTLENDKMIYIDIVSKKPVLFWREFWGK